MGKIYTRDTWVDEVLADDPRYNILDDLGAPIESVVQIELDTAVVTPGTGLNQSRMNNIENGIDTLDDALVTYTSGGSSTAFTLTTPLASNLTALETWRIKFHTTAGATPTLNRDGKGAKALKLYDSSGAKVDASATSIITNMITEVVYDGVDYVIVKPIPISTSGTLAIANGGTGQTSAGAAFDALTPQAADIASAATTDIGAATGLNVNVTGTTTITALGTKTAGVTRIVKFTGSLTLTHNATSLILPGAANIATANGDVAVFVSLGSGNWKCALYFSATNFWGAKAVPSGTVVGTSDSQTLTGKRISPRRIAVTQSATPSINTDVTDIASITGLAQAITSMSSGLSGSPNFGDEIDFEITDNGTARAITWGASFVATTGAALPTTTIVNKTLFVKFRYVNSVWTCLATTSVA